MSNKNLGNFLIIGALAMLLYIYLPIMMIYLYPPQLVEVPRDGFYITIPKISAQAPVLENIDPFSEKVYRKALEKGVAHAIKTSLPGESGTIYLFAHSSDNPWNLTRYNTIFLRLGELEIGDEIIINKEGREFKYLVREKKVVWPSEIKYLKDLGKNQLTSDDSQRQGSAKQVLILQTCTPIGTAFKRLLVFADPI